MSRATNFILSLKQGVLKIKIYFYHLVAPINPYLAGLFVKLRQGNFMHNIEKGP